MVFAEDIVSALDLTYKDFKALGVFISLFHLVFLAPFNSITVKTFVLVISIYLLFSGGERKSIWLLIVS